MAKIKITRAELDSVIEVADRFARRVNQRFVVDYSRIEVIDTQIEN